MLFEYENKVTDVDRLKREIDAFRPFPPQIADEIRAYYRIGLTYTSNALEGNSLTESETKVVIEEGVAVAGKPLREHYEAVGHSDAYSFLHTLAGNEGVREGDVCELHRLFYRHVDEANAGHYRSGEVLISGTDYIPPIAKELPAQMTAFFKALATQRVAYHPLAYAAHLHTGLVTIHPFIDGNGRVARLAMNLSLLQAGYPLAVIPPLLRSDYIACTRMANKGNEEVFHNFLSHVAYESAKDYLRMLRALHGEPR